MTKTRTKLLILSDSISGNTGLGRIARDLATRIHEHMQDVFEVAVIGAGSFPPVGADLPFPQFQMNQASATGCHDLPRVWEEFAGDEEGVLFSIWNPSWLGWMTHPERLADGMMKSFLLQAPFKKWIYAPVDGCTPSGGMHPALGEVMKRFDRVITYTPWASIVIQEATGSYPDWLPHGIGKPFIGSHALVDGKKSDERYKRIMIGCVATNQQRKDWGLFFQICKELTRRGNEVRAWVHTDKKVGYWDIDSLAREFGMDGKMSVTVELDDESMAKFYRSVDVTLGIGSGEGFGYPIFESIASGTPCIHGNYAGAPCYMDANFLVKPAGFYLDGVWMNQRPVYNATDWADKVESVIASHQFPKLHGMLDWNNLWPMWEEWLRKGLEEAA